MVLVDEGASDAVRAWQNLKPNLTQCPYWF